MMSIARQRSQPRSPWRQKDRSEGPGTADLFGPAGGRQRKNGRGKPSAASERSGVVSASQPSHSPASQLWTTSCPGHGDAKTVRGLARRGTPGLPALSYF
jgi:hypothetical protein